MATPNALSADPRQTPIEMQVVVVCGVVFGAQHRIKVSARADMKVVQERAQPVNTTAKKSDRPTRKGPSTKNEKTDMKGDAKKRYGQKGNELRPQRTSVKNSNAGSRRR